MAAIPFLIIGNVRVGPFQDYTEENFTIVAADGGRTVDLTLSSGTSVAAISQVITLLNVTNNETGTVSPDANGDYLFDANNWASGYADGNSVRVSTSTVDATARSSVPNPDRNILKFQTTANADRNLLADRRANEHTEKYPLPVEVANDYITSQNPSWAATYDANNLITTETIVTRGFSYRKTYTWVGQNLTNETAWVRL